MNRKIAKNKLYLLTFDLYNFGDDRLLIKHPRYGNLKPRTFGFKMAFRGHVIQIYFVSFTQNTRKLLCSFCVSVPYVVCVTPR